MFSKEIHDIFKPCLWDVMIDSLDSKEDYFLIINRLLEHGGDRQINFILEAYDKNTISEVIRKSSYFSPKTVNYWCLYLNIKKEETRCFTKKSPATWPPLLVS